MNLHWVAINGDTIGSQGGVFGTYVTLSYAHTVPVPEYSRSTRVMVDGGPNDASLSFSFFLGGLVRKPCLDQPQPIVLDYTRAEEAGAERDAGFWGCSFNSLVSAAVSIPRLVRLEKLPISHPPALPT